MLSDGLPSTRKILDDFLHQYAYEKFDKIV